MKFISDAKTAEELRADIINWTEHQVKNAYERLVYAKKSSTKGEASKASVRFHVLCDVRDFLKELEIRS